MTDWPILSAVTFLPLVGVVLLLLMRDDSAAGRRNVLNISLATTVVTFLLSLFIWAGYFFESVNLIVAHALFSSAEPPVTGTTLMRRHARSPGARCAVTRSKSSP